MEPIWSACRCDCVVLLSDADVLVCAHKNQQDAGGGCRGLSVALVGVIVDDA